MSLLMRIRTTDDDEEIMNSLELVMQTTGQLGLMHESINVNSRNGKDYTRPWFAWCNSEFGKTILHLAKHKPHLIFKKSFTNLTKLIHFFLCNTDYRLNTFTDFYLCSWQCLPQF